MSATWQTQLPFSPAEVFAWHQRPGAMQRLLPPWQPVTALEQAANLRDGRSVIALPGGLRWSARHLPEGYREGEQFTDELVSWSGRDKLLSPVRWRHEHRFEPDGQGGTLLRDTVDTNLPGRIVEPMLRYRHQQLAADLAAHQRAAAHGYGPATIALTGSHGLVGGALAAFLQTGGHRVIRLVRGPATGLDERTWDPQRPAADLLEGCDALIHLAGASIFGRFGPEHRRAIRNSRIEPTRALAELAATSGVRSLITASAIGIYGAQAGQDALDESAPAATGPEEFLAEVVRDWEEAARAGTSDRLRRVQVRTGLVQSPTGGILRLLRPLYAAGLGGRLGTGEQWQSWIALDDLIEIYHRALWDERLVGPVNAVAPEPVRNTEYTRELARVLRRPALLPVPALGPKLLLGAQGARELALASQRVIPAALTRVGHQYRTPQLSQALGRMLGRA